MDYISLGKNIRKYRNYTGMRQADLAEKVGYSDSYIGQIENARSTPSLEAVVLIANALNVSIEQLLIADSSFPEKVYLKDISDRIEKYTLEEKLIVCDMMVKLLDYFETFSSLNKENRYAKENQLKQKPSA